MKITVETKRALRLRLASQESILHAGLRQGLTLPYECATGTCGTCRGAGRAAAPSMSTGRRRRVARLKRDKGDVLMCQTRADPRLRAARPCQCRCDAGAPVPRHRTRRASRSSRRLDARRDPFRARAVASPITLRCRPVRRPRGARRRGQARLLDGELRPRRDRLALRDQAEARRGFSDWLFDDDAARATC